LPSNVETVDISGQPPSMPERFPREHEQGISNEPKMKTTITKIALACFCCALLAHCGGGEDTTGGEAKDPASPAVAVNHPLPGDPVAGEEVYKRICVACHQLDGSGLNGMLAADFVKDKTRLAKPNDVLINSIREGIVADGKVMPPQKDVLSDEEIKNAISYIRKTFGGTTS
jgi:mono/diheme cytochrome c family protein